MIQKPHPNHTASKCGESASARGPGQQIFSYVAYGPLGEKYANGINGNAELMEELFPGYVLRVYHDTQNDSASMSKLCEIFCQDPNIDLCSVLHEDMIKDFGDLRNHFGMIWRFVPMTDPLVAEWHSRDLDSYLSLREKAVVDDWRDHSNATYHVMRDNPYHNTRILGGMFGMRMGPNNFELMSKAFNEILIGSKGRRGKGTDQSLLSKFLWPKAFKDMVAHDSYSCKGYPGPDVRPFLTKRNSSDDFKSSPKWNFVGSNGGFINLNNVKPCPEKCRPKEHLDWLLC